MNTLFDRHTLSSRRPTKLFRRRLFEAMGNAKYSRPSLNNLDDKLAKYLDFKDGFFIEAGGNDGYTQSNTYYLEKMLGWRGLLIEAVPELYEACLKERKRSRVEHCGLVAPDFPDPTIEIHCANLMSLVEGARKTQDEQQEHLEKGVAVQQLEQTKSVQVPARTLESILDAMSAESESPLPRIDFFSLDVEGYELPVLKGLNLERYQPKYILVEATYFDEVNDFLSDRYEIVEQMSHHDYLYSVR
ncbi:MAG: FkbM family methyltransferase [Lacipirellulaceae bacterium]